MPSPTIPKALRALVIQRAQHRCEYCHLLDLGGFFPHEVDHIVATKHGGRSKFANLAYACWRCNRHKGSDLASLDPETDETTLLFCAWLALQIVSTVLIYYMTYYFNQANRLPLVLLAIQGSTLIFLFVWSQVCRHLDKRIVYILGASVWLIIQLIIADLKPTQSGWVIPLAVVAGAGVAVAYLIPWAMMPDVIEVDELETGQRREGIFYGFMVFLQKLGIALGIFMVGRLLDVAGYITPTDAVSAPVQPESVLNVIRLFMGPVPSFILFISLILAWFYPLTRSKHNEIRQQLAARRLANSATLSAGS